MVDQRWMTEALRLARQAEALGEVPVGAVLVKDQQLISSGFNQPIRLSDPSAHAEILCLRAAGQVLGNYRLPGTTLYVSLEPCPMCVGALIHARVQRVVYAASDPKTGALGGQCDLPVLGTWNHQLQVTPGVLAAESRVLLKMFFQKRR